jgi:hypothetical protein
MTWLFARRSTRRGWTKLARKVFCALRTGDRSECKSNRLCDERGGDHSGSDDLGLHVRKA